jgi:signal transduction histidine kinase
MPPFKPEPPSDALIGQIFEAAVVSRHLDSCDFRLPSGQRVRLYQHDSCAVADTRLMTELPQYAERQTCRFLITNRRTDHRDVLYYANERWAEQNPWENLPLKIGDLVQGKIAAYIRNEQDSLKGYFVQLDTSLHIGQHIGKSLQPDILVFVSVDELPWDDGSLGVMPKSGGKNRRLVLEKGDQVQLILTEINTLPRYPAGSLIQAISRQDSHFWNDANSASAGAWIKEQLHKSHLATPVAVMEEIFRLDGQRILLVDDREDSLENLQNILQKNGADVFTLQVQAHFTTHELAEQVHLQVRQHTPNLVLIDNALPQPNDGLRLIKKLFAQHPEDADFPPCALISSHFRPEEIIAIRQSVPKLCGVLLRPVTSPQLLALCKGETVWSQGIPTLHEDKGIAPPDNIPHYCAELVRTSIVDSVIVLATEHGQAQWEIGEGELPFTSNELTRIVQESELHLLIDQRLGEFSLTNDEHTELLGKYLKEVYWFNLPLHDGAQHKILGLGWKTTGHRALAQVLKTAIQDKYIKQTWYLWAQHNANFISSGITVHSLFHEYRQYLNQLRTGLDTLALVIQTQKFDFLEKIPSSLNRSVNAMTELTDTLLKGQAQRSEPVFIPDVLNFIDKIVRETAKEAKVDFRILPAPRLSLGIPAASISIPLSNLLLNAFKHHSRQQARKVSLVTQIQQDAGNYWLEFQVRDNGAGIPAHQIPRLFQPGVSFAQQIEQRNGIGLWLSRRLAKQAGGEVTLTQNLRGLGAEFTLQMPLRLG